MIPTAFDYKRAGSVDEAVSLLKDSDAKLLAGGHSLLAAMKLRLSSPGTLIDIGHLADLNYIKEDGDTLAIGAATTHRDIEDSDLVAKKAPHLAQAAGLIGDPQVRNKGTIGGSLAHADPAADYPASIVASNATMVVKGSGGERSIDASDFFMDIYLTSLQPDEIITEIRIPALPANTGACYMKFMQPASRFAVVGCAAIVTVNGGKCEDVRVGFTGVSGAAFRDEGVENELNGKAGDEASIAAAAAKAADGAELLGDHYASEDFRGHLAKVFARRALTAAVEAAG